MITALEKVDPLVTNQVDQAMLLDQPPRPGAWCERRERFRLAGSLFREPVFTRGTHLFRRRWLCGLFEIAAKETVTILAVRHQREDDYH